MQRVCETALEYFDLLVKTSAEGQFPAGVPDTRLCFYRMDNGRRCPVGLILPDELYRPEFDMKGGNTAEQIAQRVGHDWLPNGTNVNDLNKIQSIHDSLTEWGWDHAQWVKSLTTEVRCFQGFTP